MSLAFGNVANSRLARPATRRTTAAAAAAAVGDSKMNGIAGGGGGANHRSKVQKVQPNALGLGVASKASGIPLPSHHHQKTAVPSNAAAAVLKHPRAVVGLAARKQPCQKASVHLPDEVDIVDVDDDDEDDDVQIERDASCVEMEVVEEEGGSGRSGASGVSAENGVQELPVASHPTSGAAVSTALTHPNAEQKLLFVKVKTRFCERPNGVPDIYENDNGNEQMMTAYVHHIFDYLHDIEGTFSLPPRWLDGSDIAPRMRAILIDWMISLHLKFRMQVDTLYLAVDLLDRFLALEDLKVTKDELQLVGVTCLFTASKFEEIYPPDVADYVYMADGACTKSDVLAMEMVVLHKLQFSLHAPLACKFLRRYAKAAESDTHEYGIAKYILEMTLMAPDMTCYKASFKASAAQFTAMLVLEYYKMAQSAAASMEVGDFCAQPGLSDATLSALWNPTMVFYSTYTVDDLLLLVKKFLVMLENAHTNSKYVALRKKYSQDNFCKISSMDELKPEHALSLVAAVEAFVANNRPANKVSSIPASVLRPLATSVQDDVLEMSTSDEADVQEEQSSIKPEPQKRANLFADKMVMEGKGENVVQKHVKTTLTSRQINRPIGVKR